MKKSASRNSKREAVAKRQPTHKTSRSRTTKRIVRRKGARTTYSKDYVSQYAIAIDALSEVKNDEIEAIKVNTQRILVR